MDHREKLSEALRLLIAEGDPQQEGHPSVDELIAYCDRKIASGPERERIQRHLSECIECTHTVLDLEAFPDVELRDERAYSSAEEEADQWRALKRLMALESPTVSSQHATVAGLRRRFVGATVRAAAALFLAVLGLGAWTFHLHRRAERLTRALAEPQANVFVSDLMPTTASDARDAVAGSILRAPSATSEVVLILNLGDLRQFADYKVEVVDARGARLWEQRGLQRGPEGNFSISLPRPSLPAGSCEIRLFGLAGSREIPLATYLVQFEIDPRP